MSATENVFTVAAALAENHQQEIVNKIIIRIKESKIERYANLDRETMENYLKPALEMQLRYVATGDITEWKNYIAEVTQNLTGRGVHFADTIKIGQLTVQMLTEFFQKELPKLGTIGDVSAAVALENVERRLRGLNMVATSAATTAGLKQTIKNVSNQ